MTSADVKQVFKRYVTPFGLNIGNRQVVPVDSFASLFASSPSTPTAAELQAIDNGTMGYSDFIKQAQADGTIT